MDYRNPTTKIQNGIKAQNHMNLSPKRQDNRKSLNKKPIIKSNKSNAEIVYNMKKKEELNQKKQTINHQATQKSNDKEPLNNSGNNMNGSNRQNQNNQKNKVNSVITQNKDVGSIQNNESESKNSKIAPAPEKNQKQGQKNKKKPLIKKTSINNNNLVEKYDLQNQKETVLQKITQIQPKQQQRINIQQLVSKQLKQQKKAKTRPKIIDKKQAKIYTGQLKLQDNEQNSEKSPLQWTQINFTFEKDHKSKNEQFFQAFQIQQIQNTQRAQIKACLNLSCAICQGSMAHKTIITLPICGHTLHRQCLIQYATLKLTPPYERIRCPFGECQNIIKQSYLKQHLPVPLLSKYWQYESKIYLMLLVKQKRIKICPQKGCKQIFLWEKLGKQPFFVCKTTHRQICKECNILWHWRIPNCKQFAKTHDPTSNQYNYLKLAKDMNWMQCSQCLNMIQKNQGCVHIKCVCGYDFCYNCGGPFPKCHCPEGNVKVWHNDLEI